MDRDEKIEFLIDFIKYTGLDTGEPAEDLANDYLDHLEFRPIKN